MAADRFTISTREWDERSYVQGLLIHKPTGTTLVTEADPAPSGETFEVHARTADGRYLGKARVGYAHGSTVGIVSTGNGTAELWWGDERQKATGWAPYRIGQTTPLRFVKAPALPKGDVSIDQAAGILCIRIGNRYQGFKLATAKNAKADRLFDFTIPAWGKRFQGHLVFGGKLYVHRDIATKSTSKAHIFDLKGKQLKVIDTTKMGDEAEGFVEKNGTIYAVKRTGNTGPSRVIVATAIETKTPPPPPPPPKRLHGEDVSSNNADDWQPQAGDAFGFVKSTEGTSYVNPEAPRQLAALRAAGKFVGHYHAMWPGNPREQAAYFVANTDIRQGDALWCDWEKWPAAPSRPSVDDAAIFIAEVGQRVPTSRVGLYCNRNDWTGSSVKAGDGLWIAEYGVTAPNTSTDWIFWQYTNDPIDRNWSKFTSRADLDKWAKVSRRKWPVVPEYRGAERIKFRGGLVCRCVAVSLPWIEYAMLEAGVIKFNLDFFQFGYRTDVAASARTHAAGQMIDVGQYSDAALKIWREFGYMMQYRTRAQGFTPHGHGGPKGCPHGSTGVGSARNQELAWNRGRDGLLQNRKIEGPEPKGAKTPRWDTALSAYLKKIGAPPVKTS